MNVTESADRTKIHILRLDGVFSHFIDRLGILEKGRDQPLAHHRCDKRLADLGRNDKNAGARGQGRFDGLRTSVSALCYCYEDNKKAPSCKGSEKGFM